MKVRSAWVSTAPLFMGVLAPLFFGAVFFGAVGCASADDGDVDELSQQATAESLVHFKGDFTTRVTGALERGRKLRIDYDSARALCTGSRQGRPAWTVTGFYRWNGGPVQSLTVAGHNPNPSAGPPTIALDQVGTLEMWFQNNDAFGCNRYDSAFGRNFSFSVAPAAADPGWLGNASFAIERQTCNGNPCPGAWRGLESGFVYDTWARQRAAVRQVGFEVWKSGVTDFDNPDVWRQLNVQVHYRYTGQTAFSTSYVNFDGRWGSNSHYAFDLRGVDPFEWPRGANIRTAADCPTYTLRKDATGGYVEATLEFYFTVNGVALRAANGKNFQGTYQDYLGNYAVCVR